MVNVTGYEKILSGNIIPGIFDMYNVSTGSYFILIMFAVFQVTLYIKTRNMYLMSALTFVFLGLFATTTLLDTYLPLKVGKFIYLLALLQLGGLLYAIFYQRDKMDTN